MRLPSLTACTGLRSVQLFIPIKMSPVEWIRVNSFMWNRVMEMLGQIYEPQSIHLVLGKPASYKLTESLYVRDAMDTVDWTYLEQVVDKKPTIEHLHIQVGCKPPRTLDVHRMIERKLSGRIREILQLSE